MDTLVAISKSRGLDSSSLKQESHLFSMNTHACLLFGMHVDRVIGSEMYFPQYLSNWPM